MLPNMSELFRRSASVAVTVAAALMVWAPPTQARVTRIIIDTTVSPAFNGEIFGAAGQYETIAGRVFGELDPHHANNTIINDIELAPKNANGKVEYMATFFLSSRSTYRGQVGCYGKTCRIAAAGSPSLPTYGAMVTWDSAVAGRAIIRVARPTVRRVATMPSCRLRRTRTVCRLLAPSWDESSTRAAPTPRR